jgi:cell division initiation protein
MFTPQQIEQISFNKATFGGYSIEEVDEILGTLTDDYVTLYKENALLKSKMRVLVGKLEEYRENEASMKDAIVNAQKTCDMMVKEAEAKCTQMLSDANNVAAENAQRAEDIIQAENARVDEARRTAAAKIDDLEEQLRICIQALERIKQANRPTGPAPAPVQVQTADNTEAVADEISANLEHLIGTTEDAAVKPEPRHPVSETTTTKFTNLQFGRNYDPKHKK